MKDNEKYAEAIIIQTAKKMDLDISKFEMDELKMGMIVELEHGSVSDDTNISNDEADITLKIVVAHLREISDYYTRLERLENETKKVSETSEEKDKREKMLQEAARYKELCGVSENHKKQYLSNKRFTNNQQLTESLNLSEFDIVKFSSSKPEKNEDDDELYKMDNLED